MTKILVVEDEPMIADLIKMCLHPRGYEIVHISNGSLALETAEQHRPDLILLDVMLPGLDGYSIQNQLCENESLKNIPVIMMTSKTQMEDAFSTAPNVAAFISKPFTVRNLSEKIKTVLEKKEGNGESAENDAF